VAISVQRYASLLVAIGNMFLEEAKHS